VTRWSGSTCPVESRRAGRATANYTPRSSRWFAASSQEAEGAAMRHLLDAYKHHQSPDEPELVSDDTAAVCRAAAAVYWRL
jgi:hypothetical protein